MESMMGTVMIVRLKAIREMRGGSQLRPTSQWASKKTMTSPVEYLAPSERAFIKPAWQRKPEVMSLSVGNSGMTQSMMSLSFTHLGVCRNGRAWPGHQKLFRGTPLGNIWFFTISRFTYSINGTKWLSATLAIQTRLTCKGFPRLDLSLKSSNMTTSLRSFSGVRLMMEWTVRRRGVQPSLWNTITTLQRQQGRNAWMT